MRNGPASARHQRHVFAEGSGLRTGVIREFKKGRVLWPWRSICDSAGNVNGIRKVLPKKSLVFGRGTIEVVVGDPIESSGLAREDLPVLMQRPEMSS
jgi:SH3-like domain-containing protein